MIHFTSATRVIAITCLFGACSTAPRMEIEPSLKNEAHAFRLKELKDADLGRVTVFGRFKIKDLERPWFTEGEGSGWVAGPGEKTGSVRDRYSFTVVDSSGKKWPVSCKSTFQSTTKSVKRFSVERTSKFDLNCETTQVGSPRWTFRMKGKTGSNWEGRMTGPGAVIDTISSGPASQVEPAGYYLRAGDRTIGAVETSGPDAHIWIRKTTQGPELTAIGILAPILVYFKDRS
jgi:hypothetical protein